MRILHFYRTYFPDSVGGVEQVIYQICRGTSNHGVTSEVLSLGLRNGAPFRWDNHLVHRVKRDFRVASSDFSFAAFGKFQELSRQADIIHYHYPWPFMDLVHFSARNRKPSLVTYHSDIVRQNFLLHLYRPLKNRFLTSVDRIVATSPNYLATSQVLNRYRHKTEVIPIGLDHDSFPEPDPESLSRWRTRLGERFFLFVGMLRYYKGLHILLEAVRETNFRVVIVGAGPIEGELKKHAQRLGLQNVQFLGPLPDKIKMVLLRLCYAIVFPSHLRSEAFGVSLLEGAMVGKPLISTEIGTGTSHINIDGQTGLVVPPGDPAALRRAMHFLLEHPEIAAEMGTRAEERFRKLFTAERMAERYAKLYRELASLRSVGNSGHEKCHTAFANLWNCRS